MKSILLFTITACVALCFVVSPTYAQSGNPIELKKGFFKPLKYGQGDGPYQKVYTFSGLSFQPHFEEVLSRYPAALDEANKARPYGAVALAGSITMVVGSALMLAETINEAQAVSQGNLYSDPNYGSPLGVMLVGAVATIVGQKLAQKHLKRGIAIYNESADSSASNTRTPAVQLALGPAFLSGKPAVGMSLRFR